MQLRVSHHIAATRVEGPHLRFALWVAGCGLRCPGCCNPELFDAQAGSWRAVETIVEEIEAARDVHGVEGITLVGGEPLDQLPATASLCAALRTRCKDLGIIVFTGHDLDALAPSQDLTALLTAVDTVVDGPFDARRKRGEARAHVGSTNQRLRHLTDRYASPELWRGPGRAEIHLDASGEARVCGHPDAVRVALRVLGRPLASPADTPRSPADAPG